MGSLNLVLDYTKAEQDAEKIKGYMIAQIGRFTDGNDLNKWVIGEAPYYVSDSKNMYGELLQIIKAETPDTDVRWSLDYLYYIADKHLSQVCNKGLNTRKRKTLDWQKFFEKYIVPREQVL